MGRLKDSLNRECRSKPKQKLMEWLETKSINFKFTLNDFVVEKGIINAKESAQYGEVLCRLEASLIIESVEKIGKAIVYIYLGKTGVIPLTQENVKNLVKIHKNLPKVQSISNKEDMISSLEFQNKVIELKLHKLNQIIQNLNLDSKPIMNTSRQKKLESMARWEVKRLPIQVVYPSYLRD